MKKMFLGIIVMCFSLILLTGCNKTEEKKLDYLVLVNKYSQLPDDWEEIVELVDTKNAWDEDIKIEKATYDNYLKLKKDLEKDGVTIELDSVYRSVKAQQNLWDSWTVEKGIDYVRKYVAVPGYSEHHTGLAVDICLRKDGELEYENDDMIADRETFAKVHAKLADYGFILRYLENRDDVTGYAYEPWHLRYVGSSEIAKEIKDKNLTFEEYLGQIKDIKDNKAAAKYRIEKTLQDYFKETYGDKISNSRFNITKIYSSEEEKKLSSLKEMNLGKKDIAFEVIYQLQPSNDKVILELTENDGEYNKDFGWVTNISRVGILKYNDKTNSYTIDKFENNF